MNDEKIGNKQISDLTDKEFLQLEREGAFGKPLTTALVHSHNGRSNVSPLFEYNQNMNLLVNNVPNLYKWFMSELDRKRHEAASTLFTLGTLPASFNPLAGTVIGATYGALAAKDAYQNGLNLSNGILMGLSALPFARGLNRGYNAAERLAARYFPNQTITPKEYVEDYINNKLRKDLLIDNDVTYMPNSKLDQLSKVAKFNPMVKIHNTPFNVKFAEEQLRRLESLGVDTKSPIKVGANGGAKIKFYVRLNASKPTYIGYYDRTEVSGSSIGDAGNSLSFVDPSATHSVPLTMLHERNMHGSDLVLEELERKGITAPKKMYDDFIEKLFVNPNVSLDPVRNRIVFSLPDGEVPIRRGSQKWYELRATIGLLVRKYLYPIYRKNGNPQDLNTLIPEFNQTIDNLSEGELINDLSQINRYGKDYASLKENNPNFIEDLKNLIKYGAMSTGFAYLSNKKE